MPGKVRMSMSKRMGKLHGGWMTGGTGDATLRALCGMAEKTEARQTAGTFSAASLLTILHCKRCFE